MRQLARYAARLAAAVLVVAIMIGPIVAVAAIAGNPFPADLFSRIGGRNVNDATILKLLSLCFYVCWAWFCLPALRQLLATRHAQVRGSTSTRRSGQATPAALTPRAAVGDPTRGPRSALACLARFAVSSAAVVTSVTSVPGVAYASTTVRPAAVVATVGPAPTAPVALPASAAAPASTSATTVQAQHRDTPYAIASRHFSDDQVDAARDEILSLNLGRPLPDGTTYRGGGFPAGWDVIMPASAAATPVEVPPPPAGPAVVSGHVVADGESYWSISEAHLPGELGREPTPQEVLDRTEAAIAYNAPLLGYDDPKMLHTGDVVHVDAATLSVTLPVAVADSGHAVTDGESYWSISEAHLPTELGREPTDREIYDRTEAAIAYNAPLLGYDDPRMLHSGDVVHVDAVTLSIAAPTVTSADELPADPVPATPEVTATVPAVESGAEDATPAPAASTTLPPPSRPVEDNEQVPVTAAVTPAPEVPAPPPIAVSPRMTEEVTTVEHEDMLSSRWLFGGIAVTSLSLVGAWQTVKQMRRRRRRWLGLPAAHEVGTAPTDRERDADVDVAMLRQFVDPARLADTGACAVVLGHRPEIRFRVPTPPAPSGWDLVDDAWRRNDDETWAAAPVLSPALVTIGRGTDESVSEVVLDLLSAGTVSVTGDRMAVERLMCSMLWELASAPLGHHVELHIVGLTCVAAQHATNVGQLITLDDAIVFARAPQPAAGQVFLVDPFADESAAGSLRDLVEACAPGSGRAVVVAGPCEHPAEEISVPSKHRAMWDDLTLIPPQLPESVDVELGRMLDSIEIGRRHVAAKSLTVIPDPAAEAVALRSTLTVAVDTSHDTEPNGGDEDDVDDVDDVDGVSVVGSSAAPTGDEPDQEPMVVPELVEAPAVILSVCGREVAVRGMSVPQLPAVLFVLAAAGREMHSSELCEVTGYAPKSLSTVFTGSHELIERKAGALRLSGDVWTDHAWATKCVKQLADAMRVDAESTETTRWMIAALDALQSLEQAPFTVLPAGRERGLSGGAAWRWVDDFPADVPARNAAETEVAEAALAFSELWMAAPGAHRIVRAEQLLAEMCRLAATVPFAHVGRQLRKSMWVSGAECLLSAAVRVAGDDETLVRHVQLAARGLAARGQLEASTALADELGLANEQGL